MCVCVFCCDAAWECCAGTAWQSCSKKLLSDVVDELDNILQRRCAAAYQTHTAAAQLTCWQEMLTAVGHPEAGAAMVDTGEQLVFRPL